MNLFDDEMAILNYFREDFRGNVYCPYISRECKSLYYSLKDSKRFSDWINSSGKADPPPDFYNPKLKMMMEVMRVDDHGHWDEKGKYVNPVNQRESKIRDNLKINDKNVYDMGKTLLYVNAVTDLPGREDHNYDFYLEGFRRTVKKHINKIPYYKENHPGFATVFFIMDESSGYVMAENVIQAYQGISQNMKKGFECCQHYLDRRFVEVFVNSGIDFVIWFSPFKYSEYKYMEIPVVSIYDVKKISLSDFKDYPRQLIMSIEE